MTNPLQEWATRHNIPADALADLRNVLIGHDVTPNTTARSEAAVQQQLRLDASRAGWRLWRNNVGAAMDARGVPVRYGLCNDSAALNQTVKSADLIGIKPVLIEPHHIGHIIGQFVSREVKKSDWKYKGTKQEIAQLKWSEIVNGLGGDAKFSTGQLT